MLGHQYVAEGHRLAEALQLSQFLGCFVPDHGVEEFELGDDALARRGHILTQPLILRRINLFKFIIFPSILAVDPLHRGQLGTRQFRIYFHEIGLPLLFVLLH